MTCTAPMSRVARAAARCSLVAALTLSLSPWVPAGPAVADEVDGAGGSWADFTFVGANGAYTGTMALSGGFPETTFTSTSRAGGVGVQTGGSIFLNTATQPGARYRSSQGRPYLNLRPAADRAGAPSVTTYRFERATPSAGWTFVLGDIDADRVVISALDATGDPVTAAGLGFAQVINYCGG